MELNSNDHSPPSIVNYGFLQKNQEFVDWVRVETTNEENNTDKLDVRAFDIFKTSGSILKSFTIVTPDTISFAVFDAAWNLIRVSPRHTNADVAILLHAANTEKQKQHQIGDDDDDDDGIAVSEEPTLVWRTSLDEGIDDLAPDQTSSALIRSKVQAGALPLVPIRRSSQQQFVVKQSVKAFFRKESVQFFACYPYRNSPRTIYRFEIDSSLHESTGSRTSSNSSSSITIETTSIPDKWNTVVSRMSTNSANFRQSLTTANLREKFSTNSANFKERLSTNTENFKERLSTNSANLKERLSTNSTNLKERFKATGSARNSFLNLKTRGASFLKKSTEVVNENGTTNGESPTEMVASDEEVTIGGTATATPEETQETKVLDEANEPSSSSDGPAGYVALTIDDVPCRFDDRSHSYVKEVLDLLQKYNAKATFMVVSSFLSEDHEVDMVRLLQDGHELGNHGVRDEPMDKLPSEAFSEALDDCNAKIQYLQHKAKDAITGDRANKVEVGVKWFRSPQCKYTKIMEEGLEARNMYNVMCDAYAACPVVEDGPWIASALSKQITNGSIALIHMPEKRGFREYCYPALELLLEDLCIQRNFQVVTVSELEKIAEASKLPHL